jgi:prevent-host-death family protein
MRAVTIKEAKARLNELVEAAVGGEQVVLMKGSKHVAAIVPVSAEEIELPPRLTDEQAERLWRQIADERRSGKMRGFESAEAAVAYLKKPPRTRRVPTARRAR